MKKILFLLIIFGVVWVIFSSFHSDTSIRTTSSIGKSTGSPAPTIASVTQTRIVFVPYWTLTTPLSQDQYDQFVYFGISPSGDGSIVDDQGYKNLSYFTSVINPQKSLLAVTMVDRQINSTILDSQISQQNIISESISVAKKNNFSGILLDFELSGIGFDSVTKKTTSFISNFSQAAHNEHLPFITAIYSDAFYRARPFDVKAIGSVSDRVFIMAYDFHKAGGDPGPNFPFAESNADSYTFPQMIDDFVKDVPKEKLTVVLGMFGYDWPVTARGDSIDTAIALTNKEIQKSYIDSCVYSSCLLKRDVAGEPFITYTDKENQKHIIWFEDMQSAQKKIDYLKTQGIGSVAFWAHSYF